MADFAVRKFSVALARLPLLLLLSLAAPAAPAQITLSQGTNLSADVSPADGRLVMDLLGSLWLLPPGGGAAERVSNGLQPAARPRWSPDGDRIVYQTSSALGGCIRMLDLPSSTSTELSEGPHFDQHPAWHPSGQRIAFSSERGDSGFDIWEMHLPTGLAWRVSGHPGDESDPAWSADGRNLAFVRRHDGRWRLVLRRHGQAEQDLVVSEAPLAAPSWRPDGSLLTFLRREGGKYELQMVILADPPLVRPVAANQDFFLSPVSWRDRLNFIYTADGVIKRRGFNEWKAAVVPFRAEVSRPRPDAAVSAEASAERTAAQELPIVSPSGERLVIRAGRLFDGVHSGYRSEMDVLIDGGRIEAVEYRREWEDATVLDLGDATMVPGFIDVYAALPGADPRELGLALLSYGVTTVVASSPHAFDPALWETAESPGPRLLAVAPLGAAEVDQRPHRLSLLTVPASGVPSGGGRKGAGDWPMTLPILAESWSVGLAVNADLLLGAETLPASPLGRRYQDVQIAAGAGPTALVSALADAATPGLDRLFQSRQAQAFPHLSGTRGHPPRRLSAVPDLSGASSVVIGSGPNGLPAGLALHAEMRALAAAGMSGEQVLMAAGANAGDALGLDKQLGRIVPGALADLVLVAGDPTKQVADALDIVAVVRNGRFHSLVRLLEQGGAAAGVE